MYSLFRPSPPLQPFIECYWIVDGFTTPEHPLQELIFVDGKADLIFNYGDAYSRNNLHLGDDAQITSANLDAQRDHPVQIRQIGRIQLVGVRFLPGGLAAFVALPLHEASNQVLPIRELLGIEVTQLEGQLFDTFGKPEQQLSLLNQFFLARLYLEERLRHVWEITRYIQAHAGNVDIRALSQEIGYSSRTLNRIFRRYYGFSVKFFARVMRFQAAQRCLLQPLPLTEVALQSGYYDQAHLAHEFAAFTGQSPGQYRSILGKTRSTPPPNLVQFLQDNPSDSPYTGSDDQRSEGEADD